MRRKVVIVDHREEGFEIEKNAFLSEGAEVSICETRNEEELIESVRDAYVVIFTFSKISRNVIDQLTNCKMLIRYGVGLDNVDIKAASEKGISVCNTPNYGTYAVAEHAFALLMSMNRRILFLDQQVRNHIWDMEGIPPVYSLSNKGLGIVGFGNTGRYLAKMAAAFNMKVVVYDPFISQEIANEHKVRTSGFDELIRNSDHISIHAPLTDETRYLFNKDVFQEMKKTSIIVNTSRGGLINQNDLLWALKNERIAGAALDVFENEPLDPQSELLTLHNVVLTPHVAWYTEESIVNLHQEVIDDVLRVLQGNVPQNVVN